MSVGKTYTHLPKSNKKHTIQADRYRPPEVRIFLVLWLLLLVVFHIRLKIDLNGRNGPLSLQCLFLSALGKIHARMSDESAVYVLPLSSLDAPVDIDSWLDTRLLSRETPTRFSLYGVNFSNNDSGWVRNDGQATNTNLSANFADALGSLQISGLVDAADNDAASADEALRLTIGNDSDSRQLIVLHNPESDRYYFDSARFDSIFSTSAFDAERLIDAAKALLEDGT